MKDRIQNGTSSFPLFLLALFVDQSVYTIGKFILEFILAPSVAVYGTPFDAVTFRFLIEELVSLLSNIIYIRFYL